MFFKILNYKAQWNANLSSAAPPPSLGRLSHCPAAALGLARRPWGLAYFTIHENFPVILLTPVLRITLNLKK